MIKKIQISNFRSCKKVELAKLGDLVALIGRNGTGKTNILRAVDWLAQMAILNDINRYIQDDLLLSFKQGSLAIQIEVEIEGNIYFHSFERSRRILSKANEGTEISDTISEKLFIKVGKIIKAIFEWNGPSVTSPLREGEIKIGSYTGCLTGLNSLLPSADPLAVAIRPFLKFISAIRYYSIDEPIASTSESSLEFVIPEKDYKQWLSQYRETRNAGNSVSMRILHMSLQFLKQFSIFKQLLGPNVLDLIDDIDISNNSMRLFDGSKSASPNLFYQVRFRPSSAIHPDDTQSYFSYKDLSTGTRRVIKILVSLLFDESSVMLLEHPEDGIHSGLLSKLIAVLKTYAGSTQIIFASHSSTVLNELEPKDIRMVAMKAGNTTVHALKPKELKAAKQYLAEQGTLAEFLELVEDD